MRVVIAVLVVVFVVAINGTTYAAPLLPTTLAVSPVSPVAPQEVSYSGCGFIANTNVRFVRTNSAGTAWFGNLADGSGCITQADYLSSNAIGENTVEAYQMVMTNGGHSKEKLQASVTFTVQ